MLKRIKVLLLAVVVFCCIGSLPPASAQEGVDVEFVSGNVTQKSPNSLTVEVLGDDGMVQKAVMVDEKTVLENIETLDEIATGDMVFIDYVEEGEQSVAINIFKAGGSFDEGNLDEEGGELSGDTADEQEETK